MFAYRFLCVTLPKLLNMAKTFTTFGNSNDDFRRDELVRKIEHALQELTLRELAALYYDMISKDYLRD